MRDFRFGVNFGDGSNVLEFCQRAETLGFDVLLASDHLGSPAPFPLLAAAATALPDRVRFGTYVINVPFWNPALLAREFATVDRLSGGRVEIGLGSGHMKSEFDAAGIRWQPFDARADRLAATVDELGRLFADDGQQPLPVQRPRPPLLIGGTSDRLLRLAAERADVVAYGGLFQVKGAAPGTFRLATADEMDERVAFFRSHARDRAGDVESSLLVQRVEITADRRGRMKQLRAEFELSAPVEELLATPVLMLGNLDELVHQLHATRDRYGVTYFVTHNRSADALGQVIQRVRWH